MTNTVKSVRASHFKNILFVSMALNTVMNIVIITSVSYAYVYAGLLFSVIFFFGLIGLSISKLGVHPKLNARVFLLCLIPEFINLQAINQDNLALIVLSALLVGLSISPLVKNSFSNWLILPGIGMNTLAKLTELGSVFQEGVYVAAGLATVIFSAVAIILHIFVEPLFTKKEIKDDLIDLEEYQSNLKYWLDPNFKYRLNLEDGDFLTKRLLEPIEAAFPFLRQNAHKGQSERFPLIQIVTREAVPFLRAGNVKISASQEEKEKLYTKLYQMDYTWYTNTNDSNSFAIAPIAMYSSLANESFVKVDFDASPSEEKSEERFISGEVTTSEPEKFEEITSETITGALDTLIEGTATTEDAPAIANYGKKTRDVALVDPQFRWKRSFSPVGGLPLTRSRKIDPEGGSKDFQWNVPSK